MSLSVNPLAGVVTDDHVVPPFVVRMTIPFAPQAQPSCEVGNWTLRRLKLVFEICWVQVVPASTVLRTVPPSPTTQPVRPSDRTYTPFRLADEALDWANQPNPGNTVTCEVSLRPPALAITRPVPSDTPLTVPTPLTVNTAGAVLVQLKVAPG